MSDTCQINKRVADAIVDFQENNKRIYNGILDKWFGRGENSVRERTNKFIEELEKEDYDAHLFMSEKELDVRAIKFFGKKAIREALATKIMLLLETYPALSDMVHKYLLVRIPEGVYLGKELGENKERDEDFTLDLMKFPESTLRITLGNILNLVNMTTQTGNVRAKVGDRMAIFKTPKKLKWLDPSGAFESIASAVRDHAGRISSRINLFMSSPQFISKKDVDPKLLKEVKRGMEDILNDIDSLDDISKISLQSPERAGQFQALFAAVMKGYVFIGDGTNGKTKGKFYIHQAYEPRREYEDPAKPNVWVDIIKGQTRIPKNANTRLKTYDTTGDTMFSFQDPTSLESYQFPMEKDSLYINMNEKQQELFVGYTKEARAVTNLLFDYIAGNGLEPNDPNYRPGKMRESTDELMVGLIEHYDGKLTEFDIRQIFFYDKPVYIDNITGEEVNLLDKLNENEKREVNLVKETISMTITDDLTIANGGSMQSEVEHRKNYWPTIYNFDVFRQMIQSLIGDFTEAVGDLDIALLKFKKQGIAFGIEFQKLEKQKKHLEEKLVSAKHISDNMDDYHMDNQTGSTMHLAQDNKHFKRISNSYDIRSSRLDKGVFYDYLKKMMGAIEKNNLNIALLGTLKRLKSEREAGNRLSEGEQKAILEAAVNYHGTTFSSLKLTGILGDMHSYTKKVKWMRFLNPLNIVGTATTFYRRWKYGKDYNIHISPEMQSRYLKTSLTNLSGLFLQSLGSVATNSSGAHQNIIRKGWKATHNAFKVMFNGKYRKGIEKLVQQSGITEFSDFFSKAMVNGILEMQLESQIGDAILSEMLLFYSRVGTWDIDTDGTITGKEGKRFKYNKELSRIKFEQKVSKYLGQSDLWLKAEQIEIRSRGRVLSQKQETESRMRLYGANKLVQWAINKEYALKPALKNPDFKKWATYYDYMWNKTVGKALVGSSAVYEAIESKGFPLTMSKIESLIRTLSFVLGVELAWKSGSPGLRNDIHWSEYTDEKEIATVIQIGREYSYEINFGMSIQDVAQYQFGPAQALGKFKYWNQQKAEADWDIMKEALMYFEDLNEEKLLEPGNLEGIQIKGTGQAIKKIARLIKYTFNPRSSLKIDRFARQELAAYRYMMLSQGLTSFLWQTFLWNPLSMPVKYGQKIRDMHRAAKGASYKMGFSSQLRNIAVTDVMKFLTFLPAMAARKKIFGEYMDDDEFEDREKFWSNFLQMFPFAGFAVTWTYDTFIAFVALMTDNEDLFVDKAKRSIVVKGGNPQIGGFGQIARYINKKRESVVKAFYDYTDD